MDCMRTTLLIRNEIPEDIARIREITELAFRDRAYSCKREHLIIDALRADRALTVSLAALTGSTIVGHVALSPVTISRASGSWYGLGPISVMPDFQRQGVGTAMMREALSHIAQRGASGCVLVGDPGYYIRFGFANDPSIVVEGVPSTFTLAHRFFPNSDHGVVNFHSAFAAA